VIITVKRWLYHWTLNHLDARLHKPYVQLWCRTTNHHFWGSPYCAHTSPEMRAWLKEHKR